jgi:hypothetical protein
MANTKISALTELATTPDNADELAIVDGGSGGTTKKITVSNLMGAVTINAGNLTDGDFGGTAILGFDASINDQTGTAYTLLAGDNGKVVVLNNGSAVTVTVPSGLGAGFNCSFVQKGAGQVSFSASSTTINNRQSHTKINGQYGVASLLAYADDTFVLAGDTAS